MTRGCINYASFVRTFKMINRTIPLKCSNVSFGFKERALTCVKCCLTDRNQYVSVADKTYLYFGVPQGSVLGPKNYCMYTKRVGEISKRFMTLKPGDKCDYILSPIEASIENILIWMNSDMLKMNKDKTECIVFSSNQTYEEN